MPTRPTQREISAAIEAAARSVGALWSAIVTPTRLRNDAAGLGHFGASRGGGKRRHNGYDLIVAKGQPVFVPADGTITRQAFPYGQDDPRWTGVEIALSGFWKGYQLRIFYMEPLPDLIGKTVTKGQQIGTAQDISEKWGRHMMPHIHVELRKGSQVFDPAPLIHAHETTPTA